MDEILTEIYLPTHATCAQIQHLMQKNLKDLFECSLLC